MNAKKLLRLFMLLLFINVGNAFHAIASDEGCGCQTSNINIGTGINPISLAPLSPGAFEPSWLLTQSPDPSLSVPGIPFVIPNGAGVWGNGTPTLKATLIANASYISPFNTQSYMVNNPAPDPAFVFRLDFCVCTENDYIIEGLLNGDDYVELWLDGTTHIQTCGSWVNVVNVFASVPLSAGSHYLELRLRNTGAQAMGVALSGTISSSNGGSSLIGYNCCNPRGGINGRKYLDDNCNGIIDADDPVGTGWTFVLNPGNIIVNTDVLGYFNFPNLAPGVYTVSEVLMPGWSPVLPNTSGAATVNVVAGEITTVDFLNTTCDIGCEKECYWRVTGNNTIDPTSNYLGTNTTAPLIIKTNSIERARIEGTGDGYMGIATNSPTTIFHTYAASPSDGAPSGLRFEELPWGEGNILVVDDEGYVYRSESGWARKGAASSMEMLQMQQQVSDLKNELSALKSMLQGGGENSLKVSPNPTGGQVTVTFRIAQSYTSAIVRIVDNAGKTVMSNIVSGNDGTTSFTIPHSVASGNLTCTLLIDGQAVATQKIILLNK